VTDLSAFNDGATLSSPNRIVWEYFDSIRRLVEETRDTSTPELCRQNAALAVIMAITAVEVFLNLWFRIRVEELQSTTKRDAFLKDISSRKSLDHKLKNWPTSYLDKSLNLSSGAGAEFIKLKGLRNSIVHFSSTHETFQYENVVINGFGLPPIL
jgi:hypothetical protein